MHPTTSEIARRLGAELRGDASLAIAGMASLEAATSTDIAFVAGGRHARQLAATRAGCVIVPPSLAEADGPATRLVVPDPYLAFARLTQWWAARRGVRERPPAGVHATAVVEAGAWVDESACIGPLAHVAAGARIHAGAVIGAQSSVGRDSSIGEDTWLAPRVVVAPGCSLGRRCIVHPGAVIGADGFGFAPHPGGWEKIEQLGAVRIGDDVEIGANTCIDRGALSDTVIEDGVKLDNLVQVAHNVHIGQHTAVAGCAGIAGSARIGKRCAIGGAANILGHLSIADGVHISPGTMVTRSIHQPGLYSGTFPFDTNAAWEKNAATVRQLFELRKRLRELERRVGGA
jgi:UDP-3-O-[3-hydroxymyristoyl] glucosamine N-acyltransferase